MNEHDQASLLLIAYTSQYVFFERKHNREYLFRYPCIRTARILLQCGADVNAKSTKRLTPLHVFVSESTHSDETILRLLCDAGAHLDYVNESGRTPLDITRNTHVKLFLQTKMTINLKCICARQVQRANIPFHGKISNSLATFVERH